MSLFTFSLCTYRVPNLEFDDFVIDLKTVRAKLNADSDLMFLLELVVHDSLHEATLSDAGVADDDEFEEVVLGGDGLV